MELPYDGTDALLYAEGLLDPDLYRDEVKSR